MDLVQSSRHEKWRKSNLIIKNLTISFVQPWLNQLQGNISEDFSIAKSLLGLFLNSCIFQFTPQYAADGGFPVFARARIRKVIFRLHCSTLDHGTMHNTSTRKYVATVTATGLPHKKQFNIKVSRKSKTIFIFHIYHNTVVHIDGTYWELFHISQTLLVQNYDKLIR